jgi:hypothetical protein
VGRIAPGIQPRYFFLESADFLDGPLALLKQFAQRAVAWVYAQAIEHVVSQVRFTPFAKSRASYANRAARMQRSQPLNPNCL